MTKFGVLNRVNEIMQKYLLHLEKVETEQFLLEEKNTLQMVDQMV